MIHWESDSCARFRVARGVTDLQPFLEFYGTVLCLPVLYTCENHDGFSGVVFGLPNEAVQLEFVLQVENSDLGVRVPDSDSEIVLYLSDQVMVDELVARLVGAGHEQVVNRNPYWANQCAKSVVDPGGWTLILQPL